MKSRCRLAFVLWLAACVPALPLTAQPPHAAPRRPVAENTALVLELGSEMNIAPGKAARVQIAIKNRSAEAVILTSVTVGDKTRVDALRGKVIEPGKTVRWKGDADVRMPPNLEYGPGVVTLEVESTVGTFSVLRDVRRLEPFELKIELDARPVFGGAESRSGDTRSLKVILLSRMPTQSDAKVSISLPSGWSLIEGRETDTRRLRQGERKQITYKILVPLPAEINEYTIGVTATVGERTYTQSGIIAVTR